MCNVSFDENMIADSQKQVLLTHVFQTAPYICWSRAVLKIWPGHMCSRKVRSGKTVVWLRLLHRRDKASYDCPDSLRQTTRQIKSYNWLTLHLDELRQR